MARRYQDGIRTGKTTINANNPTDFIMETYVVDGFSIMSESIINSSGIKTLYYLYDDAGDIIGFNYGIGSTYLYGKNIQGDVVALFNSQNQLVARYYYDAWGNVTSIKDASGNEITSEAHIAVINPIRYRSYHYDRDTGFYYLNSRYYDPQVGRFISADVYVSTGQGLLGNNMFTYCGNNPVNKVDPTGQFWITALVVTAVVAVCMVTLSGCSSQPAPSSPRSDLANAPDLDVRTALSDSYNCYGNGIGKQIVADPTGYQIGDSTRKTFDAVKKDLGKNNVRELDSINSPIKNDEFKVAMKCGPNDYHFIRLDKEQWYNKSGLSHGLYVPQLIVEADIWYAMFIWGGNIYMSNPYYDDETIYFDVKVGWDS